MCVNNLSNVALDSASAGIEPAISSRKSNAPNHYATEPHTDFTHTLTVHSASNPGTHGTRIRTVVNAARATRAGRRA